MSTRSTCAVIILLLYGVTAFTQISEAEIEAREEFRWGVGALHDGKINEAIASLSRSIGLDSDDRLTRYWLGRAYYYGGFETAALQEWRWIAERGPQSAVLQSWIERLELDRGLVEERLGEELAPGRYVTMVSIPGRQDDFVVFQRPTMVRPNPNGSFYVTSFGTHSVVLLDANGVRRQVIDGGIEGFSRPFDVLRLPSGELLVSEFGADRIARVSALGVKTGTFGGRSREAGGLIGPQFMAHENGYIYVTDYGNNRIAKYSTDGDFLFSFGGRAGGFTGLRSPAGLVATAGRVYVSDTEASRIVVFDSSGNYLGEITNPLMRDPEGLSAYGEDRLLVSDANRLYVVDPRTEQVFQLSEVAPQRQFLGAAIDANGNGLAADFAQNGVPVLAAGQELYTGMNVEVDAVEAVAHPEVYLTVSVTDRQGRPVVGLTDENFRITEDRFPTGAIDLVSARSAGAAALSLLVDRNQEMAGQTAAVEEAALSIVDALGPEDRLWTVSAAELPVVELAPGSGRLRVASAAVGQDDHYGLGAIDLGIRLAGAQLLREAGSRSIVLVSNGSVSSDAFSSYGLTETSEYLRNNHIRLFVVYTERNRRSEELDFLVRATSGSSAYLYRPEGVSGVVEEARARPSGRYVIRYSSVHDPDFGRRYIPVEVEAYLLERSGRDESGYFGPLDF